VRPMTARDHGASLWFIEGTGLGATMPSTRANADGHASTTRGRRRLRRKI
jgi:hypothetical protein